MHSQQNNIITLKSQYIKLIHISHMVTEVRKPNLNTFLNTNIQEKKNESFFIFKSSSPYGIK